MSYETHGQLPGIGSTWSCKDCGTVVREVDRARHDAFHVRLETLQSELAELTEALGGKQEPDPLGKALP